MFIDRKSVSDRISEMLFLKKFRIIIAYFSGTLYNEGCGNIYGGNVMKLITNGIKGTEDVLPCESYKWQFVEDIMRRQAQSYGFKEIRTPVIEHTELFRRSVGDVDGAEQKDMYTFTTRGGESVTLRPEGTAGAARAMLEHGAFNDGYPVKVYYLTSCYRYEKPRNGYKREFRQFGMEIYGAPSFFADAELICAANSIFDRLGVRNLCPEINSVGCEKCRPDYQNALREYFVAMKDQLCETCRSRLDREPVRILDCKSPACSKIAAGAPKVSDYICGDCKEHFEGVKDCLKAAGLRYKVNPRIVRSPDYYSRTVFEFVSGDTGAQGTVCSGGRYDGLIGKLGGQHTPALGFALDIGCLLDILESQKIEIPEPPVCDLYVIGIGDSAKLRAFNIIEGVRAASLIAEGDIVGRSVEDQMEYAGRIKARFSMVIGDAELENNSAKLRRADNGTERLVPLDENFFSEFFDEYVESNNSKLLEQLDFMK